MRAREARHMALLGLFARKVSTVAILAVLVALVASCADSGINSHYANDAEMFVLSLGTDAVLIGMRESYIAENLSARQLEDAETILSAWELASRKFPADKDRSRYATRSSEYEELGTPPKRYDSIHANLKRVLDEMGDLVFFQSKQSEFSMANYKSVRRKAHTLGEHIRRIEFELDAIRNSKSQ